MLRGTRIAQAYVAITADGSNINEEIVDAVDDAGDDIEGKGKEHGDAYGESFSEGFLNRMRGRVARRLSTALGGSEVGGRAGDEAGESFVDRMTEKVSSLGDKIGAELSDRLASDPEQVRRGINRAFNDDMLDRVGDRAGSRIAASMAGAIADQGAVLSAAIAEALEGGVSGNRSGKKSGIGDVIGRLLGAGSRNNALNFFGKTMGNVVGLIDKAGSLASTFASNMGKAAEGASLMTRILAGFGGGGGGVGGMLAKIGATAPMAVAALGTVIVTMSVLASVAGALVGILVAMVSTIASALVGALAIVGPLLGGLAVSVGLVTAAFTSMTEAQREYLSNAFQPLKAAFTGIGQIIFTEFTRPLYDGRSAIQVWSSNLQQALLPLAGVARTTAGAFAEAGNIITGALSGPGFQRFFTVLARELPTIVVNMSRALGGFMNGVGGMFAAILPLVTRFSGYLADVASRFSRWANSAQGQNAIVSFVDRAVASLKSLWGFVKEFGGLLGDIFFSPVSQRSGNTIFDSLAKTFEGFRKEFQKAARSGDLERWFNDAIEFGSDLWGVVKSLWDVFMALYNSGVLEAVGDLLMALAGSIEFLSDVMTPLIDSVGWGLPNALSSALFPIQRLADSLDWLARKARETLEWLNLVDQAAPDKDRSGAFTDFYTTTNVPGASANGIIGPWAPGTSGNPTPPDSLQDLINAGNTALNNTFESNGGYMPDPTDPTKPPKLTTEFGPVGDQSWQNPYLAWANSMVAQARKLGDDIRAMAREGRGSIRAAIKDARTIFADLIVDIGSSFASGISDAVESTDITAIFESFQSLINTASEGAATANQAIYDKANETISNAIATRDQMVALAEAAKQAAAQRLAGASSKAEAKAALAELKQADDDLQLARRKGTDLVRAAQQAADEMIAAAGASRAAIARANAILGAQAVYTYGNALALVQGLAVENATLADYAEARRWAAERLGEANQKLTEALALRDNYSVAIAESIRTFGSLMTVQAKTINGVAQALTAGDVTDNLRNRLTQIKKFQEDLRQLLALGLSDAAYKQIVDAGVESGGALAEAILQGGQGSISEVNNLTKQISDVAGSLGDAAASHLYQAGVDAAQGLVDGLTSLSAQLDSAAARLGASIAAAIKRELGIASPSKVLYHLMYDDVGDGAVQGLDAAGAKVGAAAARLASQVAVSPEVAAYAARQGASATTDENGNPVSGNLGPNVLWTGDIVTPTEDPHAVSTEVLNELTERLT